MKLLVIFATIFQAIEILFNLCIIIRHGYFDDDAVGVSGLSLLPSIFFEMVFIVLWCNL